MSARRKPKRAVPLMIDAGPAIRLARGDVQVVTMPDPERPNATVKIAKARSNWRAMDLTGPQWDAAAQMEDTAEIAGGACWRPDGPRVSRPAYEQGHPSEHQVIAAAAMRAGKEACGQDGWFLLEQVVLGNIPMVTISEASGESYRKCRDRLTTALDKLARAWRV